MSVQTDTRGSGHALQRELHVALGYQSYFGYVNKKLTVPEASVPAVLIWTLISAAGMRTSAIDTL